VRVDAVGCGQVAGRRALGCGGKGEGQKVEKGRQTENIWWGDALKVSLSGGDRTGCVKGRSRKEVQDKNNSVLGRRRRHE